MDGPQAVRCGRHQNLPPLQVLQRDATVPRRVSQSRHEVRLKFTGNKYGSLCTIIYCNLISFLVGVFLELSCKFSVIFSVLSLTFSSHLALMGLPVRFVQVRLCDWLNLYEFIDSTVWCHGIKKNVVRITVVLLAWEREKCRPFRLSPPTKKKLYIDSKNVSIDILYCYRTRIMRSCHLLNNSLQTSIK